MPYEVYIAKNATDTLAYPHYTRMDLWRHAQLIYGVECETQQADYSDRLWEWDHEAARRATEECNARNLPANTAMCIEQWLCFYHNKPVLLRYIMAGSNWSNGYPYYVYGYDFVSE
jgi:hypothetical protein